MMSNLENMHTPGRRERTLLAELLDVTGEIDPHALKCRLVHDASIIGPSALHTPHETQGYLPDAGIGGGLTHPDPSVPSRP
jgi:hypothetical protein